MVSFEGDQEYLCERGHYSIWDVHSSHKLEKCACGASFVWWHIIDHTNGYDEEDPSTFEAAKVEIGWDDIPQVDHYGTAYFTKNTRWEPAPESAWARLLTEEEVEAREAERKRRQDVFMQSSDKFRIFEGETLLAVMDTEEEFDAKYEGFLSEGRQNLSGYYPERGNLDGS